MGFLWRYLPVVVALMAGLLLAAACEDGEEEGPTSTATLATTASATSAPAAIATATVTPRLPEAPIEDIVLGMHAPLSGTWGAAYASVIDGAQAFFKYLNEEEGGVCGREIVFKVEDSGYSPAGATEAVAKLLERHKVYAIIGGIGTAPHAAVWEELNERGVPDLWIMSGAHKFGMLDYYIEGTIFGRYISENMPGKNVGILYQNDEWGQDVLEGLKNGLDPEKNELVSEESYELTDVSLRPQVTSLKNAGAEIVISASSAPISVQLIKEADRLEWHPQFFLDYVILEWVTFAFEWWQLPEGVITLGFNKLSDWTDDPAVAEHHRIQKEYGTMPPGSFTMVGQEVAALTVEALSRSCDNLTRKGLMDAVHSFEDYQADLMLPGVTITLSPTDHLAIESMMLLQAKVEDGKGKWEPFGELLSFR